MILPLYGGWSELDVLAKFAGLQEAGRPGTGPGNFQADSCKPNDFTAAWAKFLHDGFLVGEAAEATSRSLSMPTAVGKLVAQILPSRRSTRRHVRGRARRPTRQVDDGRYANNGWLQELPDPITKLTWDNAALISPTTAKKLGIKEDGGDFKQPLEYAESRSRR